ncbi:MAG: Cys-rich protein [Leptospirales bacterium]|nr:Cys-rich protein [Leptospirales bacterium]
MLRSIQMLLLVSGFAILAGANCKKLDCTEPCRKMVECPAKMHGQTPTSKEMDLLTAGCNNSCSKHGETMWKCYEQAKNSADFCNEMLRCAQMKLDK